MKLSINSMITYCSHFYPIFLTYIAILHHHQFIIKLATKLIYADQHLFIAYAKCIILANTTI
jgi:hypothetical protein